MSYDIDADIQIKELYTEDGRQQIEEARQKTGEEILTEEENPEFRIQNSESRIQEVESEILTEEIKLEDRSQESEVRSQKSEVRSQEIESRIQNPESRIQETESEIVTEEIKLEDRSQETEVRNQETESRIQNSEFRIQEIESEIVTEEIKLEDRSQKSEVRSQKSEVRSQEIEFRIQNSESRILENESEIVTVTEEIKLEDRSQETEFRIQNSEFRIQNSESGNIGTKLEIITEEEKKPDRYYLELPVIQNYIDIENVSLVEVLFKGSRKGCFLNIHHLELKATDTVLVEVEGGGVDSGTVSKVCKDWLDKYKENCDKEFPKYKVFRIITPEDTHKIKKNTADEGYAVVKSKDLVRKHNLDMKVTEAEWQFDRQRLTVYFTAPQRIDFRDLVKDLARMFKTRIELRQISSREEQKRVGFGMGGCGQMLCCTSFLNEFCHVTLDHARTQQLSNNVAKLSGNCGRLKCCLLFEYDNYVSAFEKYPPLDSLIRLKEGVARISKVDVFKDLVHLHIQESGKYISITYDELCEHVKNGNVIYSDRKDMSYSYDNNGHDGMI